LLKVLTIRADGREGMSFPGKGFTTTPGSTCPALSVLVLDQFFEAALDVGLRRQRNGSVKRVL
jgi:hypothetical protein